MFEKRECLSWYQWHIVVEEKAKITKLAVTFPSSYLLLTTPSSPKKDFCEK